MSKLARRYMALVLAGTLTVSGLMPTFAATEEQISRMSDNTVLIGGHIFDLDEENMTLDQFLTAIRSIEVGKENTIYYKNNSKWYNLVVDGDISSPIYLGSTSEALTHVNGEEYIGDKLADEINLLPALDAITYDNIDKVGSAYEKYEALDDAQKQLMYLDAEDYFSLAMYQVEILVAHEQIAFSSPMAMEANLKDVAGVLELNIDAYNSLKNQESKDIVLDELIKIDEFNMSNVVLIYNNALKIALAKENNTDAETIQVKTATGETQMREHGTLQMEAELTPTTAEGNIIWSATLDGKSDDVSIDENGLLTVSADGKVEVTAEFDNLIADDIEASLEVFVFDYSKGRARFNELKAELDGMASNIGTDEGTYDKDSYDYARAIESAVDDALNKGAHVNVEEQFALLCDYINRIDEIKKNVNTIEDDLTADILRAESLYSDIIEHDHESNGPILVGQYSQGSKNGLQSIINQAKDTSKEVRLRHDGLETYMTELQKNIFVEMDTSEAKEKIDAAQDLYDKSVEGTGVGEYSAEARAAFLQSINGAKKYYKEGISCEDYLSRIEFVINYGTVTFKKEKITMTTEDKVIAIKSELDKLKDKLITEDMDLITEMNGLVITWKSGNRNYLNNDGSIERFPTYNVEDVDVELTATIEIPGEDDVTYPINVVVKRRTVYVNELPSELLKQITYPNSTDVTDNISLQKTVKVPELIKSHDEYEFEDEYPVVWEISKVGGKTIISDSGIVTRPDYVMGSLNQKTEVNAEASVQVNEIKVTKPLTITVLNKEPASDAEKVDYESLRFANVAGFEAQTGDFELPTIYGEATITWVSSDSDLVEIAGNTAKVKRPLNSGENAFCRLTPTLTVGGESKESSGCMVVIEKHTISTLALENLITAAQTEHDNAGEGTQVGEYASGSKLTYKAAIDEAQDFLDKRIFTDEMVESTVNKLRDAQTVFKSKEVAAEKTDQEKVDFAKASLMLTGLDNVIGDLIFPVIQDGVNVEWTTDNEDVIAFDGTVNQPSTTSGAATVVITATLKLNEASAMKEFTATVQAK